ncbi:MAG: hypothetical protein K6G90_10180 [Clostridia bacterium]|nr:hypothetical protein [Clostridia bacterium]
MYINTLPARLISWLSGQEALGDCIFSVAYQRNPATRPVEEPTVTIGGENMSVEDIEQGVSSRSALTSFVVSVHTPSYLGGERCADIAARLLDALLFGTGLNIGAVTSDKVRYDRNTDTIILEFHFTVAETVRQTYDWSEFL